MGEWGGLQSYWAFQRFGRSSRSAAFNQAYEDRKRRLIRVVPHP